MKSMFRKNTFFTVALVMALALAITVGALAESSKNAAAEAVVNTTTDETQITSPFISVVNDVQQSVVGINNYQTQNYYVGPYGYGYPGSITKQSEEALAGTGSGVVIAEGYVLTNYHVVNGASRITISVLNDDTAYEGTVVGYDSSLDIAIVQVPELKLPAVELGDSNKLQVGEWAICIGNPLGQELAGTVTMGIISALDREVSSSEVTLDQYGLRKSSTNSMIQTNAAINSGNSGGGLFNMLGQLQGIPTLKYTGSAYSGTTVEGIGMAIPINAAKPLIQQVLSGKTVAKEDADASDAAQDPSETPRLGVTISAISSENNYAVAKGSLPNGVMIHSVEEGSPAENGGLKVNDVIVEADGTIITSVDGLQAQLKDKSVGDTIQVKVYRVPNLDQATSVSQIQSGEYIELSVTLTDSSSNS